MRASWTGTIGFGLVNINVGTCPAVSEKAVQFKQYHEQAVGKGKAAKVQLNPVGRKDYDKETGEVIEFADVIRGYTAENGVTVKVEDDELAALAPEADKRIEIEGFVDAAEVEADSLYFAKHEYAMPRKGSEKAYGLLVSALEQTGKVGIGRRVLRGKNSVLLVRVVDGALVLTTLYWADEVRGTNELDVPVAKYTDAEAAMAVALVQTLVTDWKPAELTDTHRAKVLALLEAKAEGKELPVPDQTEHKADVSDLMGALAASVEASKAGK